MFDKFELTTDDRIIQTVDKLMLNKRNELDVAQTINTAHYAQIFTSRLNEAYNIPEDAWLTIAIEGFDDYGELVKLYQNDQKKLNFDYVDNNEFYFQSLKSHDNRLVDPLGFHLNAYDLELPKYIKGEINLYAGKGTHDDTDDESWMYWSTMEDFQFYPNEYNFTSFEFTVFTDRHFEVSLDLNHGGDFSDIISNKEWWKIKPFGITVQTEAGERYIDRNFFYSWQHDTSYPNKPIYTFSLLRDYYEYIGILSNTEVVVTYYYQKESLSYFAEYDDILYGNDYMFIIRNSQGSVISDIENICSIEGNNITFTDKIKNFLEIGESFTIEYEFRTKKLLDTKHLFIEIQPWEMKFYNSFYPFSGGSIIAPLYYNLSANYQYQLALNYRLQEKDILTFSINLTSEDIQNDMVAYDLGYNIPIVDYDNTPVIIAYFYNEINEKVLIPDDYLYCTFNIITIKEIKSTFALTEEDTINISIFPELHNKYQLFHNLKVDLVNDNIVLTNWTVFQDPQNNLIPNYELPYFIFEVDPYETTSKGKVKEIYAILNETNYLTYYLTEDLNDPINGWKYFDTLIMKLGFLNPEVLDYLEVSFYYENNGEQLIGSVNVTIDMIDMESGAVYIRLPESTDFNKFTIQNGAQIVFRPIFRAYTEFQGFYYQDGYPTIQLVEWNSNDVKDGFLEVELDSKIISENQSVYVFNDLMEYMYEDTEVNVETEEHEYDGSTEKFSLEFNTITIPEVFLDTNGNTIKMRDGDILFLKYKAFLEASIGINVEDMVLQRKPYFENYETNRYDIPIAEISLLGVNVDGNNYSIDDIFENREKLVAWETSLDITPFESELENTYKQQVFNISFADIKPEFKKLDEKNIENCYFTDIMITSNDPRYEIVVDSFFIFEFDENANIYDSDIFEIYPNNHMETFYFGNYSDIYSNSVILNTSEFLPIYHGIESVDETYYFEVFDNLDNWYYFGEHLIGEEISSGVYNITWNLQYCQEYYYAYINQYEDLSELYDYYNPHIDKLRYLYLTWADKNTWNEWQTIEQANVNISTLDITFEWYDETPEEYESVVYNQTCQTKRIVRYLGYLHMRENLFRDRRLYSHVPHT
ncbi:hypothetical protein ES705_16726 [subsurface metagenome]